MTSRPDLAPARDAGFNPAVSPPDRTSAWLIVGTLAALAVLIWAAWADTRPMREEPRQTKARPAWIPAPQHQERALAQVEVQP